ncbi:MAG TPA: nucleoside 2-deoxyribosyltransferase [Mariprofundaceae bacterium]|nr:nucleoside 2-deoxyribosyltransferase [Mariprofundaceae bacterium]
MKPTVYLAGAIAGLTENEANDWRHYVAEQLGKHGIIGVSPLRCEPLHGETYSFNYPDPKFGTARAIGSKNVYDVRNCDMTLAFLPGPRERLSIGTVCELAGAHFINKQTILVSDDEFVRSHPVLDAMSGWVLDNLDDAIEVCVGVLGAYTPGGKNV